MPFRVIELQFHVAPAMQSEDMPSEDVKLLHLLGI